MTNSVKFVTFSNSCSRSLTYRMIKIANQIESNTEELKRIKLKAYRGNLKIDFYFSVCLTFNSIILCTLHVNYIQLQRRNNDFHTLTTKTKRIWDWNRIFKYQYQIKIFISKKFQKTRKRDFVWNILFKSRIKIPVPA